MTLGETNAIRAVQVYPIFEDEKSERSDDKSVQATKKTTLKKIKAQHDQS